MANAEESALKKKISVLRKALLRERADNQTDLQEIELLQNKSSTLDQILQEKDSQIEAYDTEKRALEEILLELRETNKASATPAPPRSSKKNLVQLEQENRKLLEEYHFFRQENSDLQTMYSAISAEYSEIQKALTQKDNSLKKVVEDLENTLTDTLRHQAGIQTDLADALKSNNSLQETNRKLEGEVAALECCCRRAEEETEGLDRGVLEKQGAIASLNERLLQCGEAEARLLRKLMEYKNALVGTKDFYQQHRLTKVNNFINHPATLTLKRDHTGDFVIEIEEKQKKTVYALRMVDSVLPHQSNASRFSVIFQDGVCIEFESESSQDVFSKIRNFIMKSLS